MACPTLPSNLHQRVNPSRCNLLLQMVSHPNSPSSPDLLEQNYHKTLSEELTQQLCSNETLTQTSHCTHTRLVWKPPLPHFLGILPRTIQHNNPICTELMRSPDGSMTLTKWTVTLPSTLTVVTQFMCVVAVFYHVLGVVLGSGDQIYKLLVKEDGGEKPRPDTELQGALLCMAPSYSLSAINPKRFLAAHSKVQYVTVWVPNSVLHPKRVPRN